MESSTGLSTSISGGWSHLILIWKSLSKHISGQKRCVSLALTLWGTVLSQCCTHVALASYSNDPQLWGVSVIGKSPAVQAGDFCAWAPWSVDLWNWWGAAEPQKRSEVSSESVKAFILVIMAIHHFPHDQCSCKARFHSEALPPKPRPLCPGAFSRK